MQEARVSIVIALYNKAAYLEATIASILSQTISDWQLIIVDDSSTDSSYEKAASFLTDNRITLVKQKNAGPGVARNKGLELVTTPYVTFLDADDSWEPNFLQEALAALENNLSCDLWLCGASWQPLGEQRDVFLKKEVLYKDGPWTLDANYTAEETYEVLNFFATGAVVIKTKTIKLYGGYFDYVKCTSGEDGYLWLQVMYNHTIYRCRKHLLIVNTAASDLGIGRKTLKPVPPWLTYPEPIRKNCPPQYKDSLNEYFQFSAFLAFRREVYQGRLIKGLQLIARFPGLSKFKNQGYPFIAWALLWYPFKHYARKVLKS